MTQTRPRILIVGGYGAFGTLVAERLAREAEFDIIIAGRSLAHAQAAAVKLQQTGRTTITAATITAAVVNATSPNSATLRSLAPTIVINASGPFQTQDYALARAAIEIGAHYIDLADASDFVSGIVKDSDLDVTAKNRGLLVVSGASTVPGISGAILDHYAPEFARLTAMHHGISPGNSFDPGPATTASILGAIGKPFQMKRDGRWRTVHGWQGLSRYRFPAIGGRWMGYCNVPDLVLFAARYPSLRTIEFKAGVDVSLFHLGIWALSWPSRWGLLPAPGQLAKPLLAVKRMLGFLGTDVGGMFVTLDGVDHTGAAKTISWHMIAARGDGPYIPTTPAVILAKKLARNQTAERGARACAGLVTLEEIQRELSDLAIEMSVT